MPSTTRMVVSVALVSASERSREILLRMMRLLLLRRRLLRRIAVREVLVSTCVERPTTAIVAVAKASVSVAPEAAALTRSPATPAHVVVHPSASAASVPAPVHAHTSASTSSSAHVSATPASKPSTIPTKWDLVHSGASSPAVTSIRSVPVHASCPGHRSGRGMLHGRWRRRLKLRGWGRRPSLLVRPIEALTFGGRKMLRRRLMQAIAIVVPVLLLLLLMREERLWGLERLYRRGLGRVRNLGHRARRGRLWNVRLLIRPRLRLIRVIARLWRRRSLHDGRRGLEVLLRRPLLLLLPVLVPVAVVRIKRRLFWRRAGNRWLLHWLRN